MRSEERYVFRMNKNRVFYVKEDILRRAATVSKKKLVSLGTMIGRFTKTERFMLTIQSLDVLAKYAGKKVRDRTPDARVCETLLRTHTLREITCVCAREQCARR